MSAHPEGNPAMLAIRSLLLPLLVALALPALADEAEIRKNLAQRLPEFPKIDEVTKSAVPGLWEVRIGNEILYTDAEGDHIFEGELIDTKNKANLTRQRIAKLTAIKFDELPLKDAMVIKQGNGSRKLAVFADPNCGYCKRLERDLVALKDVTIYNFVYPVLGPDSNDKSRAIWCSKDAMKTWRDWMIDGVTPPRAMGKCDDAAIQRTLDYGKKYRINGTPAIVFENGDRVPGALPAAELAKRIDEAKKPKS
jgi:thiol:disulfide interchange protein DsbC